MQERQLTHDPWGWHLKNKMTMMVMMTKSVIDDDFDKVGDDKSFGQYNKGGLGDDDDDDDDKEYDC